MEKETSTFSKYMNYARPWSLLTGVFLYALGGSLVNYLGMQMDWGVYMLGQGCGLFLHASGNFLKAYFDAIRPIGKIVQPFSDEERRHVVSILQIGISLLTISVVMAMLLFIRGAVQPAGILVLVSAFLLALFYGLPPVRLAYTGYGEISEAFMIANLMPALAFTFQAGDLHRLLGLLTFPITMLYLAGLLALSLQHYASDQKKHYATMMMRLGWERGMLLHNILIFAAYILFGLDALAFSVPWTLTWPALLTLPLGTLQVVQMIRISNGSKPQWQLLSITAIVLPILTSYFLAFSLWIR